MDLKKSLEELTAGLLEVRRLSQQRVDVAGNANGYRILLEENKKRILEYAEKNNRIIEKVLEPLLEDSYSLNAREKAVLSEFCEGLLVSWPEKDLDLTLHFYVAKKLYEDARKKEDDDELIRGANRYILSCYNNLNRVNRLRISKEFTEYYKQEGLSCARVLLSYLDHDKFLRLTKDQTRVMVFANARFYLALYDTWYATDEVENEERIDGLVRAIVLSEDEWFRSHVKDYDWRKFVIRCYEHMGQLTENGNQWNMTPMQCKKIMKHMENLKTLWESDVEKGEACLPRIHMELLYTRNSYYANLIDLKTYQNKLLQLYHTYANSEYDMYSVLANILLPCEYLKTLSLKKMDETQRKVLREFYQKISAYVLKSRGSESFSFLLEYLNDFFESFIEIPKEYSFSEMALTCLAALNPPTFVHGMQCAYVARNLCGHILKNRPESFVGGGKYTTLEDVRKNRERIEHLIFHGCSMGEIGKLSVMDTVISGGRKMFYPEKELLELSDAMGEYLKKRQPTMKMECEFLKEELPAAIIRVSKRIVSEYEQGRSLGDITETLSEEHYELREIFDHLEVREDLASILHRGIDSRYMDVWLMLWNVHQNDNMTLSDALEGYVIRTVRIRELSAPQPEELENGGGYEQLFKQQFMEIGTMAEENKKVLSGKIFPLLESSQCLSDSDEKLLQDFCQMLLNGQDLGDIDQGLVYLVSKRLLEDAHTKDDVDALVRQLDIHVSSCYEMAHQAKRMCTAGHIVDEYREEGLQAAHEIWSYMEQEKFQHLCPESKELVLINIRYAIYLYETSEKNKENNDRYIYLLQKAFNYADDDFYVTSAKDYDWNYHKIRCLEYLGQSTECGNARGFSKKQCSIIAEKMMCLKDIWERNPKENEEILPYVSILLMLNRSRFFAGEMDVADYRESLRQIYHSNRNNRYDFNSIFPNLVIPLELIISYEGKKEYLDEEETEIIELYTWVIGYVARAKNGEAFSLLLEYFSELLYHFIEIEGKFTFEQMGLYCMAALHPPTYIHSRMGGEISRSLCASLLEQKPALFIGVCGCRDESMVLEKKNEIENFCYHAALCHDFGKIPMVDTIFVYGRNLLDHEFALLKHHPRVGGLLLESNESTKAYADIARGHHRWYDCSRGYPEEYNTFDSPNKILIDIVCVADCMDAATDSVGRSYSGSKTADQIMDEVIKEAGSRYHPEIAELLKQQETRREINRILNQVRRNNYKKTYDLLEDLLENGINSDHVQKIQSEYEEQLDRLRSLLKQQEYFLHARRLISYDQQTVCPKDGQEEEGALITFMSQEAYKIRKKKEFSELVCSLYEVKNRLSTWDRALVLHLYRQYLREKNMTPSFHKTFDETNEQAYIAWQNAREANDYRLFQSALKKRIKVEQKRMQLVEPHEMLPQDVYDRLLDEYETGLTSEIMDGLFAECIPVIRDLMTKSANRSKRVRTDFLYRPVTDEAQKEFAKVLLHVMGFDTEKGTMGLAVHPFTERLGRHDTRVTTHFEKNCFISSMYSVIHECGHALFEQNQPKENFTHYIADNKTMGQHESVSRFYENIIGRSEAFIHFIYPEVCRIFPEVMADVSEKEFYEAVNVVQPSLIRTEADELTYSLHIYIRYEMEKALLHGEILAEDAKNEWNRLYETHLGVCPKDDLTGILQDIHWTDSFGYFPTYVMGNFYGAMYLKKMQEEFDPFEAVSNGDFKRINAWMTEHVFAEADSLPPFEWIYRVTGRHLTSRDFVDYITQKYGT